jgi:hypothetical protein
MLGEVELVMFAIEAAAKLGRKIQTVFEDETRDQELILPPVPGTALPPLEAAVMFFEGDGKVFVETPEENIPVRSTSGRPPPQGLYYEIWQKRDESIADDKKIREAYLRIQENLWRHSSEEDVYGNYRSFEKFYSGANALFVVKQWRDRKDPKKHPVQRIAGTVIEIALDYVRADPALFSGNGTGNRITRAFLLSLDEVEFAESEFDDLLLEVLQASLDTFRSQLDLVISEDHLASLLKEVSTTLSEAIKQAKKSDDPDKLDVLYTFRREILQNVIQTSAKTVSEYSTSFFGTPDSRQEKILASVLKALLNTVEKESDLFTVRTIADIYGASLRAVAENASLLVPSTNGNQREAFLENLFAGVANQLAASAESEPPGILTLDLLRDVIAVALEVTALNVGDLINPDDPEEQLLVDALEGIVLGLSKDFHNDGELADILSGIFSRQQLIEIIQEVFGAVAENPQALLRGLKEEAKRSPLAQIIGSVALAAKSDTAKLLKGRNYEKLVAVALRAFAINPDRLLGLDNTDPRQNVMAQVITAVVEVAAKNFEAGGRNLTNGQVLVDMTEAALKTVSKNVEGFVKEPEIVSMVLDRLCTAASGVMANELDGENLLSVFPKILTKALSDRSVLDLSDSELVLPSLNTSPQ